MSASLTKTTTAHLAQTSAAAKTGLKVKHVMLLDTGDLAFSDDSIKVKPDLNNPANLVLKCTSRSRLLKAIEASGLAYSNLVRGSKHWIAFTTQADFSAALEGGSPQQLNHDAAKTITAKGH